MSFSMSVVGALVGGHVEMRLTLRESPPSSPDEPPRLCWRESIISRLHCFFDAHVQRVDCHDQVADRADRMLPTGSFELIEVLVKVLAGTYREVDQRKQSAVWEIVKRNCAESRSKASESQGITNKLVLKNVNCAVASKLRLVKSKDEQFHQGVKPSLSCPTLLLEGKAGGKSDCCYRENRLGPSCPHLWLQAWRTNNPSAVQRTFHADIHFSCGMEA